MKFNKQTAEADETDTMTACKKHQDQPARGYSECPGCEVESQRAEIASLKAEILALRDSAALHTQLQRAAGGLPAAYIIKVVVERGGGSVEVYCDGNKVVFDAQGPLVEQVSDAIELVATLDEQGAAAACQPDEGSQADQAQR